MDPLRVESLFPTALHFSIHKPHWPQSPMFWRLFFPVQDSQAGEPRYGAWTPCFLRRTSVMWLSFCLWVTYPGVWVLTILHLLPFYPPYCGSFFIFLFWKIFSASLQVVLIENCSVNVIILMSLWEEVSSGPSYSAILATPPSTDLVLGHFNLNTIRLVPLPHPAVY